MKQKKSSSLGAFNSRLAKYSATAGAALLAVPAAHATIQNITDGLGGNLIVNGSHTATPILNFQGNPGTEAPMLLTMGPFKAGFHGFNTYSSGGNGAGDLQGGFSPVAADIHVIHSSVTRTQFFPKNVSLGLMVSTVGVFRQIPNTQIGYLMARAASSGHSQQFNIGPAASASRIGYLAFKTTHGSNQYYGWLRIKVSNGSHGFPDEISLVDNGGDGIYGAFGLKSDDLKVGQTAMPVPEPSSLELGGLGLLALGAQGVREMRRRRKAQESLGK